MLLSLPLLDTDLFDLFTKFDKIRPNGLPVSRTKVSLSNFSLSKSVPVTTWSTGGNCTRLLDALVFSELIWKVNNNIMKLYIYFLIIYNCLNIMWICYLTVKISDHILCYYSSYRCILISFGDYSEESFNKWVIFWLTRQMIHFCCCLLKIILKWI